MNVFEHVLARKRVVLAAVATLTALGALAFATMPKQEDPSLPDRSGLLVVPFPGADATTVERLVVEPLEDALAEVGEIRTLIATARRDVAVLRIELTDETVDVEPVWDDVRESIDDVRPDLPEGIEEPDLSTRLISRQEAIVFAVVGAEPLALRAAAERVERRMRAVPGVADVTLPGDPGRQVIIEYDEVQARRLDLPPDALAAQLSGRNQTVPAGSVRIGQRTVAFDAGTDFPSVEAIASTPLALPGGGTVVLGDVARVRLAAEEPASTRMRVDGQRAVAIGVKARAGLDVVALGRAVRSAADGLDLGAIALIELSFQPDYVDARLRDLSGSLLLAIGIVAGVLVLFMGLRLGLLVASVVPLVAVAAVAVYAFGGGVLHQLSIAALVLALGLLVDNAIVVAEAIQQGLDAGLSRVEAARDSARNLWLPLAIATGTTLAAFVPMYASKGPTGDFTRAIPVVAMITLVVSYVYAVFVTPVLAAMVLRPRARSAGAGRVFDVVARLGVGRPWTVLALALIAIGATISLGGGISKSFFPGADRDQMVVEVILPEGTHLDDTDVAAQKLEVFLRRDGRVQQVSTFVGRSAPSFFYNLPGRPSSAHFAHVIVRTVDPGVVEGLVRDVRSYGQRHIPEAEVVPRVLAQGPPLQAPIEVRLSGHDLDRLDAAARAVMGDLRGVPGTANVRLDSGLGLPTLRLEVNDAEAARRQISRTDVALALLRRNRGIEIGQLRTDADPLPIVLRASEGERSAPDADLAVHRPGQPPVPVTQVATPIVELRPAVVQRRDGRRTVTVSAQLTPGTAYSEVLRSFESKRAGITLPDGVALTYGGAVEGAGKANAAIGAAAPLGAAMLILLVLFEFNSFRRLGIILSTIPLAAVGIVPGLVLGEQPFGFMSLLGVFALVGIVVNNAIVLLDVIDRRRGEGASVAEAVADAVRVRTRPILLTTATTIAGLLPLALSDSNLWPPMAWAMMTGLAASTALTLLVVPALYTVLFRRQDRLLEAS